MKIEILMCVRCGHGQRTAELVAEIVRASVPDALVESTVIATEAEAERLAFPGSPTVRVDGVDIDPDPPTRVGLG